MKILRKIWPPCLLIGFVIIFFAKNTIPSGGNFIGGSDIARYFLWNEQFIKEQLMSGHLPLWNPYYYSGHPFLANPQTFVFYPATLLYAALPLPWAFNIDTLLHVYLAALGTYLLVSLITESKNAGLASAIIYCLNGYFMNKICSGNQTMVHTAALLPWVFYLFEKGYKTGQTRFFVFTGIIFGLQILSGEPQNNYYTLLFLVIYTLIRYFAAPRPQQSESFYQPGIILVLILLISFGISAAQVLPSFEFMSLSDRAEKTYQFATAYSFPPENFFTFLTPSLENSSINPYVDPGYTGIMSLILAMTGVILYRSRPYIWCFRIIALIAVTIMLGKYTPLYHLYYLFPGISLFRIPARCMIIFVFSLAVLAGFGVQQLCRPDTPKKNHTTAIALWLVLFVSLFAGMNFLEVPLFSKEILTAVVFFIIAFVLISLSRFLKNKSVVAGLIIAILFAELYFFYHPTIPIINENKVFAKQPYEYQFANDNSFFRVATPLDALLGENFHYCGINGYTPLALKSYFRFVHEMADVPILKETRNTLNPQIFHRNTVFSSKVLNIKYAYINDANEFEMITADKIMPRAALVGQVVVLPELNDQLQYMKRPDFDPQQQILLQSPLPKSTHPSAKGTEANSVTITKYQPERIELNCVSDTDTCLVLSELFYPGWQAYLDGEKVQILRADYLLRAIALPAGHHKVVFVCKPMSLLIGGVITILTIILIAVFYFTLKTTKSE